MSGGITGGSALPLGSFLAAPAPPHAGGQQPPPGSFFWPPWGVRPAIGGPTGAFVVIVYGIVQKYGIDGLTVATLMAGVLLVIFGVAKFGGAIKFIPHPVVAGFTSGIAVIIFSGEIKDFFGLQMGAVPADFIGKWVAFAHATGVTPSAVVVGALSLAIILSAHGINRQIRAVRWR